MDTEEFGQTRHGGHNGGHQGNFHGKHRGHHGARAWWDELHPALKGLVILGGIALGIGAAWLFGMALVWLWNWLMPDIFGLPRISFWQAWGLLILSSIFFKGSGGSSRDGSRKKKRQIRRHMEEARAEDCCGDEAPKADTEA